MTELAWFLNAGYMWYSLSTELSASCSS